MTFEYFVISKRGPESDPQLLLSSSGMISVSPGFFLFFFQEKWIPAELNAWSSLWESEKYPS